MALFTEDEITCMKVAAKLLPQLEGARSAGLNPTWTIYVLSLLEGDACCQYSQEEAKLRIEKATQKMFDMSADDYIQKKVMPEYKKFKAEKL